MMVENSFIFNEEFLRANLLAINDENRFKLNDVDFTEAAVLFLLVPHKHKPYDLVFILRTHNKHDRHSGEISFPGGKRELGDKNLFETATRECEEEIGVPRDNITILGCIDDYSTPAFFIITPIVGFIDENTELNANEAEVAEIISVPITFFAKKQNYTDTTYILNGEKISIGKFVYKHPNGKRYIIWGATAHLITNFLEKIYHLHLMSPGSRRARPRDFKQMYRKPTRN